jgi:hypothetical protein
MAAEIGEAGAIGDNGCNGTTTDAPFDSEFPGEGRPAPGAVSDDVDAPEKSAERPDDPDRSGLNDTPCAETGICLGCGFSVRACKTEGAVRLRSRPGRKNVIRGLASSISAAAAGIPGIRVLDHVIVTRKGFYSFQDAGLLR